MSKTNQVVVPCGAAVLVLVALGGGSCGGGPSVSRLPGDGGADSLDVRVSAGGPVSGATVTAYAAGDDTGAVLTIIGDHGVIGTGGPTDASGKATVKLSVPGYPGPVQVVASGATMIYPDPTVPTVPGQAPVLVQIPANFVLSSYLAGLPTAGSIPVTIVTTLADHAAMAYVHGLHPLHPGKKTLSAALADRDHLFVHHITTSTSAWNPANFRTTLPASLTGGSQTLVDTTYAAIFDIGLNALAHKTAEVAVGTANSSTINAITLAQLLEQDLDADGVFDGRGDNGAPLATQGTKPVPLDSQFLRKPFAQALDQWIQTKGVNQSGIAQADLVSAGVYDAITQDGTDLFGAPPAGPFDPVDRVPPELALVSEPKLYTTAASLTLAVTATDPSGVAHVWCQFGNSNPVAAQQGADGTWSCKSNLVANQPNPIAIWAEDGATPSNSGQALGPPYRLMRTIIADNTAPQPVPSPGFRSYRSESGLVVNSDSSGRAVVPAVYTSPNNCVLIDSNADIFKAATRLGWTTQPTAAQLEDPNLNWTSGNFPTLQVKVPFSPQTDSPIVSATYSVVVGSSSPVTGALWPAAKTDPNWLYYDLPLASNLFPALTSISGRTSVAVGVTVTDEAGNSNTVPMGTFYFHVIGPPLAVVEDANYQGANDGKSTFPYRMNQANYATLYDGSTTMFNPENTVRLVHYIVTNPAPQPVALTPSFAGAAWYDNETWTGAVTAIGHAYYALTPGRVQPPSGAPQTWCSWIQNNTGAPLPSDLTTSAVGYSACAGTSTFTPPGGTAQCDTDPGTATIGGAQTFSALATNAYYQSAGTDGAAASTTASGRYVVPAASSTSPGLLSLYVVRPRSGLQARISLSGWNGSQFVQDVGQEGTVAASYHHPTSPNYGPCQYYQYSGGFVGATCPVYQYSVSHYTRTLSAAADSLGGTLAVQTFGLSSGSEVGEVTTVPGGTFDLTRSISH